MPNEVLFSDARLKIKRAREHMIEFDAHAAKVFGSGFAPYSQSSDFDAKSGEYIIKFSATREVITRFAILSGDAIHNLRTALDFAWFELTAADSPVAENRIRFPVYPTRKLLEDFIKSREEQQSVVRPQRETPGYDKALQGRERDRRPHLRSPPTRYSRQAPAAYSASTSIAHLG